MYRRLILINKNPKWYERESVKFIIRGRDKEGFFNSCLNDSNSFKVEYKSVNKTLYFIVNDSETFKELNNKFNYNKGYFLSPLLD